MKFFGMGRKQVSVEEGDEAQAELSSYTPYTINNKARIIEKLRLMQHKSVPVNVSFPPGAEARGFVTTLIEVLRDQELCAFDAPDLTHELNTSGEVFFSATVDGVAARFKSSGMHTAKLNGLPAYMVPIPTSLYWCEKRGARHFSVPIATPIFCTLQLPGKGACKFPVLNVSETGFCILDKNQSVVSPVKVGYVFHGCQFSWPPDLANDPFSAELRYMRVIGTHGVFRSFKMGFQFINRDSTFKEDMRNLLHKLSNS